MADSPPPQSGHKLPPIEMPQDLEPLYVNLVRIAHSPSELVFDFARLLPGGGNAKVKSRIVMSPLAAKLFQRALSENLAKYESVFGQINVPGNSTLADNLFRPTHPPDAANE